MSPSRRSRAMWMYRLRGCGASWAVIQHSAQQLTPILQQKMGLEFPEGEPSTWLLCLKSSPLFSNKDVSWSQEDNRIFSLISLVHWKVYNLKYPWISLFSGFVWASPCPALWFWKEKFKAKHKWVRKRSLWKNTSSLQTIWISSV